MIRPGTRLALSLHRSADRGAWHLTTPERAAIARQVNGFVDARRRAFLAADAQVAADLLRTVPRA